MYRPRMGYSWVLQARARVKPDDLEAYRNASVDPSGRFAALYGVGTGGATLVRPDGFVSWRATELHSDPADELAGALRAALARDP